MDLKRINKTQLELLRKSLIEYYSGVDVELISKRYGLSVIKINSLSQMYREGNFSIFEKGKNTELEKAMESQESKLRRLESQLKVMEHSLKMANIKIEGYEFMNTLLKKEYGVDLPKKLEAKLLNISKSSTKK